MPIRGGEGTTDVTLHAATITITFKHEKDSLDGWDFYKGSHNFTKVPDVSLTGVFQNYAESDKKEIEKKARITANATFPVKQVPNALLSINKDYKLFVWVVTRGGEDGTKQQVYFYLNDKFLGTDTKVPKKQILNISTEGNTVYVEYTGDVQNYRDDIFVGYIYENGKIMPDENFARAFK